MIARGSLQVAGQGKMCGMRLLPGGHYVRGCKIFGSGESSTLRARLAVFGNAQQDRLWTAAGPITSWHLSSGLQFGSRSCVMADPSRQQCRATHNVDAAQLSTRPSPETLHLWRTADAVCFDVDSTVSLDEGIDELATFCGAGEAVAAWTARAMGGSVPFEEALAARLALFQPSFSTLTEFLTKKPSRLTPGITDLISGLQSRGVDVFLVSGGFRQMIEPIASILHIPRERIFANTLLFHPNGQFSGFDLNEPTCRSGGKAEAIASIKQKHGYHKLVMIGDGATDLEARKPGGADIFICYGGVQLREAVAAKSDWSVMDFEDLIQNISSS